MAIPDSYLVHTLMQNYTPTHCINNQNTTFLPQRGNSYCGGEQNLFMLYEYTFIHLFAYIQK